MKDQKEMNPKIKAFKLYAGDDGHSYFQEGFIDERLMAPVQQIHFKTTPPGSVYDWHTAPCTQYVITLSGILKFTTSLGETFVLNPGEILIATDIEGRGHKWELVGDAPWVRTYVTFDSIQHFNFTAYDSTNNS